MNGVSTSLLLTLLSLNCGCSTWEKKIVFAGPVPGVAIEIQQPFPANGWGLRVVLATPGNFTTLYQLRGDVFLDFAEVAWSRDGESLAIFSCGTPALRIRYKLAETKVLAFEDARSAVAAVIRSEYGLSSLQADDRTFEWACSQDGKAAFLRRHPGARPR